MLSAAILRGAAARWGFTAVPRARSAHLSAPLCLGACPLARASLNARLRARRSLSARLRARHSLSARLRARRSLSACFRARRSLSARLRARPSLSACFRARRSLSACFRARFRACLRARPSLSARLRARPSLSARLRARPSLSARLRRRHATRVTFTVSVPILLLRVRDNATVIDRILHPIIITVEVKGVNERVLIGVQGHITRAHLHKITHPITIRVATQITQAITPLKLTQQLITISVEVTEITHPISV